MANKVIVRNGKDWKLSKTMWAGILQIVIGILLVMQGQMSEGIPLTVSGVLFTYLRTITKEGVFLN